MSDASFVSSHTVNFNGMNDIPLEKALDETFLDIQKYVNFCHCNTREFVAMFDQDDDILEETKKMIDVCRSVDLMEHLFSELKSVLKQCLNKPTAEEKIEIKVLMDKYKIDKIENKKKKVNNSNA